MHQIGRRVWRGVGLLMIVVAVVGAVVGWLGPQPARGGPEDVVLLGEIDDALEPNDERYVERLLEEAESREATALVLLLDTPGGLGSTMRNLVEQLLSANMPTVVFVSPRGAQAASAGTLVTVAANVAAMAPGTNIGAAAPISGTGEDLPPTLRKKVDEDTTALVRSIAALRGRNAEAIEATVLEAKAYTADEALALGVIDRISPDLQSLLNAIDGQTVETAAGPRRLETADAQLEEVGRSMVERFLEIITNPSVTYALVLLGTYGVIFEIRDPGNFGPGVLGVLCLTLGFLGIGLLPVNLSGVLLLVAGCALLLLESQMDGFGWAGIGAAICWLFAGFLLFGEIFPEPTALDDPLEISRWVMGVFGGVTLGFIALLWLLGRGAGKSEAFMTAVERAMIDRDGLALDSLAPSGGVEIAGEHWIGMTEGDEIAAGTSIRVIGVYAGGIVKVARSDDEAAILAMRTAPARADSWRSRAAAISLPRLWSRLSTRKE